MASKSVLLHPFPNLALPDICIRLRLCFLVYPTIITNITTNITTTTTTFVFEQQRLNLYKTGVRMVRDQCVHAQLAGNATT